MSDILEKQAEAAVKAVVVAAGISGAGEALQIRAFLLDDAPLNPDEPLSFPVLGIQSAPARQPKYRSSIYEVPLTLVLATHHSKDPKRTQLVTLYATLRPLLESNEFTGQLDGYRFIALTFDDSDSDIENRRQVWEMTCTFRAQKQNA